MTGLKPCPFCGGEADGLYTDDNSEKFDLIWCPECGSTGPVKKYKEISETDLINWWNDRVNK